MKIIITESQCNLIITEQNNTSSITIDTIKLPNLIKFYDNCRKTTSEIVSDVVGSGNGLYIYQFIPADPTVNPNGGTIYIYHISTIQNVPYCYLRQSLIINDKKTNNVNPTGITNPPGMTNTSIQTLATSLSKIPNNVYINFRNFVGDNVTIYRNNFMSRTTRAIIKNGKNSLLPYWFSLGGSYPTPTDNPYFNTFKNNSITVRLSEIINIITDPILEAFINTKCGIYSKYKNGTTSYSTQMWNEIMELIKTTDLGSMTLYDLLKNSGLDLNATKLNNISFR